MAKKGRCSMSGSLVGVLVLCLVGDDCWLTATGGS
jgi:hypothetical protein